MKNEQITTRRDFLSKSMIALGMIALSEDLYKQFVFQQKFDPEKGLFFSKSDLPEIRKNIQMPFLKQLWESLLKADLKDDLKFLKEELDFNNHVRHISRANEILKRSAFVALVDSNKDHEEVAKLAIEKILKYKEWDYFIENDEQIIGLQRAPETTIAIALAYDWIGDKLSKDIKDEMIKSVGEKGVPPCYYSLYGMQNPETVKGWGFLKTSTYKIKLDFKRWPWILDKTNLKAIPISGLMIGAIFLYDKHPKAKEWLNYAQFSLKRYAEVYGKDGSYHEGISYWGYATYYVALSIAALKRSHNIDLRNIINFPGSAKYFLQMKAPFKENPDAVINFSDASFYLDSSPAFWIAKEFKDGFAQKGAEEINIRKNLFSIIWYDGKVKSVEPTQKLLDARFANEWIISRSGWTEKDTVIGFRSGGPANHEHADRNSIIVNAFGERLLHDPLGAAYVRTEKHWLLRQTEAHNAILVDGKGHQYLDGSEGTNSSRALAVIKQYNPGKKLTIVTSDATQAYKLINEDILKIQRTLVFIKPDLLIILDELKKNKIKSAFQSRFQAFNVDGKANLYAKDGSNMFEIIRPTAALNGKLFSGSKLTINTGNLDIPLEMGIFPFIEVSTEPEIECKIITVCSMYMIKNNGKPETEIIEKDGIYSVSSTLNGKERRLKVVFRRDCPQVSLV